MCAVAVATTFTLHRGKLDLLFFTSSSSVAMLRMFSLFGPSRHVSCSCIQGYWKPICFWVAILVFVNDLTEGAAGSYADIFSANSARFLIFVHCGAA